MHRLRHILWLALNTIYGRRLNSKRWCREHAKNIQKKRNVEKEKWHTQVVQTHTHAREISRYITGDLGRLCVAIDKLIAMTICTCLNIYNFWPFSSSSRPLQMLMPRPVPEQIDFTSFFFFYKRFMFVRFNRYLDADWWGIISVCVFPGERCLMYVIISAVCVCVSAPYAVHAGVVWEVMRAEWVLRVP